MPPDKSVQLIVNHSYYFATKRYVVGTQNHLNETQMIGKNINEILTLKILLIWTMDMTYSLARIKAGRKIPPPVFTDGIYRYFLAWKIRLKWQILANDGKYNFFVAKYWQM